MTLDRSIEVPRRRDVRPVLGWPFTWRGGRRSAGGPAGLLGPLVLLVLAQLVVATGSPVPLVRPVLALATLLGVPTLVLVRRAGLPGDTAATRGLYAFGLSLLGAVLVGLLLNTVLPYVGIDRPLQPAVLAAAWLVVDACLLSWRRAVPLLPFGVVRRAVRRTLRARWEPAAALATGALLLAVAGAVRLNNGAGGGVALTALVVAAAAVLVLLARPAGLARDCWVLGLVAAGLLLATSLRGWHITGHDIQAEYLVFRLANDAQHWQMGALRNAYNACLSVNILPTVLAQTTGLSGEVVFKLLLQLVYALVPVAAFLLARRMVPRTPALVAAVFTMAFPTFFTDMPYLVRQEVAFFFLALLLLAATERGTTPRERAGLVAALGTGVVLSHYSTTYVLLMALVLGLVVHAVSGLGRRAGRREDEPGERRRLVLLHPLMIGLLMAITFAWAGLITHTGGHAATVARETVAALTGKFDGPGSSDTGYWLLSRDRTTPRERMNMFVRASLDYRTNEIPPRQRLVRHLGRAELRPRLVRETTAPPTVLGRALGSVGLDPVAVNKGVKLGCAAVLQLFLLLGLGWLLRRRGDPRAPEREVVHLTLGAVGALGLIVLVPNLSVEYGVLRAFQQTLLVVGPTMAMGMLVALRPFGRRAAALKVAVPVLLVLTLTGVLPAVIGGQQRRIAVANSGLYYQRYFVSDSEAGAVSWLAAADRVDHTNARDIASRNVNVRLLAATENTAPVSDRLYPTVLTRHSYVFVDSQIVDRGVSTVFYTGDLLTYVYPTQDLARHLDLVYSSPHNRIYR